MATHSSILEGKIPWTEVPIGLQFMGSQSQTRLKRFSTHTHITTLRKRKQYKEKKGKELPQMTTVNIQQTYFRPFLYVCVC